MAHLTDKPLGLVKLQRELQAAQSENQRLKEVEEQLSKKNQELETEIAHLRTIISKKTKKAPSED